MSAFTTLLGCLLLAAPATAAAERLVEPSTDIEFASKPVIDGKPFLCLGTGVRKKAIFKVYAVTFCVEEAGGREALAAWLSGQARFARLAGAELAEALESDEKFFEALLAMPVDKAVEMAFVRDVGLDKVRESFTESLVRTVGKAERGRIATFVSKLDRDLKKGDRLTLHAHPNGDVTVGLGESHADLHDDVLARALWVPYLGPDSISPTLKRSVARGAATLLR
jgi:hypothetical protein